MKFKRKKKDNISIYLAKGPGVKYLNGKPYYYPRSLGKDIFNSEEEIPPIEHDCRLVWDRPNEKYFLHIPIDTEIKENQFDLACSLDPGVRIFNTVYGSDGVAYLVGDGSSSKDKYGKRPTILPGRLEPEISNIIPLGKRKWIKQPLDDQVFINNETETETGRNGGIGKIHRLIRIAARMRSGIQHINRNKPNEPKIYKKTSSRSTLKNLRRLAAKLERRVKNMVKDTHCKLAKFLCLKYKTIIIPKFQTSKMVKKGTKRNIGKKTALCLTRWGHYNFKMILRSKGEIEGCNIIEGTEEYTSKTCSVCFHIKRDLKDAKQLNCRCGMRIHRDLNAARNIMILNWNRANLHNEASL